MRYYLLIIAGACLLLQGCNSKPDERANCANPPRISRDATFNADGTLYDFRAQPDSLAGMVWYLDDKKIGEGPTLTTKFDKVGDFVLRLTTAGGCLTEETITVQQLVIPPDTGAIKGPDHAKQGEEVTYKEVSGNATSWAWDMRETNTIDGHEQSIDYTFTRPGVHQIAVHINGSKGQEVYKSVTVEPAPIESVPTDQQILQACNASLTGALASEVFYEKYLHNYATVPVVVNGKGPPRTFSSFRSGLMMDDVKALDALKTYRKPDNTLIKIEVRYKSQTPS